MKLFSMRNILVPTDFSADSAKAAMFAADIARLCGATLHIMNAMGLGFEGVHEPFPLHEKYNKAVLQSRQLDMDAFVGELAPQLAGVRIETDIESAEDVNAIVDVAFLRQVDLIVMGARGAGKIKEKLVGTTTSKVITRSTVPVLVVPAEYQVEMPDGILLATSNFEQNQELLKVVIALARIFNATVHVIHFIDTDEMTDGQFESEKQKLETYLGYLESTYRDIRFMTEVIRGNEFESSINDYHMAHKTDIVAMIKYLKGFWEKLFNKSITKKMIFHSDMPVLVIPAES